MNVVGDNEIMCIAEVILQLATTISFSDPDATKVSGNDHFNFQSFQSNILFWR